MTTLLEHLKGEPIVAFAVLVAVILIVPLLFERLNLPGLVGLLAAGILFGPPGLSLLYTEDPVIQLLSDSEPQTAAQFFIEGIGPRSRGALRHTARFGQSRESCSDQRTNWAITGT